MPSVGIVVRKDITRRSVGPKRETSNLETLRKGFQKNQANTIKVEEDDIAFLIALSTSLSSDIWYLDSCASQHMTRCRTWISKYKNLRLSRTVTFGDDRPSYRREGFDPLSIPT